MPSTPRYSVAFFQNIGLDVKLAESVLERMRFWSSCCYPLPDYLCVAVAPEVLALKEERVKPTGLSGEDYFPFAGLLMSTLFQR